MYDKINREIWILTSEDLLSALIFDDAQKLAQTEVCVL